MSYVNFPEIEALLREIFNTQILEVLANSCGGDSKIPFGDRENLLRVSKRKIDRLP